jgi:hypothetical protein
MGVGEVWPVARSSTWPATPSDASQVVDAQTAGGVGADSTAMRDAAEHEPEPRHHKSATPRLPHWIADRKPLQLAPETFLEGSRPKTALQIALDSGQHSLASLLLKSGYRLDLERYAPLDLALEARRCDLFELLLAHGADLKDADVYTVLNTYNVELYTSA